MCLALGWQRFWPGASGHGLRHLPGTDASVLALLWSCSVSLGKSKKASTKFPSCYLYSSFIPMGREDPKYLCRQKNPLPFTFFSLPLQVSWDCQLLETDPLPTAGPHSAQAIITQIINTVCHVWCFLKSNPAPKPETSATPSCFTWVGLESTWAFTGKREPTGFSRIYFQSTNELEPELAGSLSLPSSAFCIAHLPPSDTEPICKGFYTSHRMGSAIWFILPSWPPEII